MEAQMRTARTTVLLTDAERAELDAFAMSRGESVSNVVRDATVRYMAQPPADGDQELLALLAKELNEAAPRISASLDRSSAILQELHAEMDQFFREKGIR
jgi:hypothetical protein